LNRLVIGCGSAVASRPEATETPPAAGSRPPDERESGPPERGPDSSERDIAPVRRRDREEGSRRLTVKIQLRDTAIRDIDREDIVPVTFVIDVRLGFNPLDGVASHGLGDETTITSCVDR
jgi:hypothetical protein